MATKKKLLQAAAGAAAGGAGVNVEEVFSTYLYTGNASTQAINNGIDLSGEGGLLWIKKRSGAASNFLFGSDRSADNTALLSNTSLAYYGTSYSVSHSSTGFTVPATTSGDVNESGQDYASWTFRKAPKFFTCLTYTGTGSAQTISHDLGTTVGTLIVKRTDTTGDWLVQHRSLGGTYYMDLQNTNAAATNTSYWNNTTATSTEFTVGTSSYTNASGGSYVAYLFAHNDGDGDFGPTGDQDIIKCGSYTGNGSSDGQFIDLGFEPQWLLVKKTSAADNWILMDNMRGLVTSSPVYNSDDETLRPNTTGAEVTSNDISSINPTGFTIREGGNSLNSSSATYIYIAIRRGPMAVPESATDVFDIATRDATPPAFNTSFDVDMALYQSNVTSPDDTFNSARLMQGDVLRTNTTDSAISGGTGFVFDYSNGWYGPTSANSNAHAWMWGRAPSFFDVVAYTGTGTARTVSHNLGVPPEMMWIKMRSSTNPWGIYHSATGNTKQLNFDTGVGYTSINYWGNTTPTDQVFTVGSSGGVNSAGYTYIAYLFASLDGISKVGSYTGNGTDGRVIDCGFSSGARFVLIKGATIATNWYLYDSTRGIVSGNDPYLLIDTKAGSTTTDYIDPHSSGFIVNNNIQLNNNGSDYIFYAIA